MRRRMRFGRVAAMTVLIMVLMASTGAVGAISAPAYTIHRSITKNTPGHGEIEVTLTFKGHAPAVVGIAEHLPEGATFLTVRADISNADYFQIDRESRRIVFTVFDGKPVRYRVALSKPATDISGYGVDLLRRTAETEIADRVIPITGEGGGTAIPKPDTIGANRGPLSSPLNTIPCDDGDGILSAKELADGVCGFLLGTVEHTLEDVRDAAVVYAVWGGRPKTIRDMNDREIVFYRPADRIITTNPDNSMIVIALGCGDRIVGTDECTVGSCICQRSGFKKGDAKSASNCWSGVCGGRLDEIPQTSTRYSVNYEFMAALNPDAVLETVFWAQRADTMAERVGAPVVVAGADFDIDSWFEQIRVVGELLDRKTAAAALVALCREKIRRVTAVTENLRPEDKPLVYFAPRGAQKGFYDPKEGRDFTRTYKTYDPIELAGGVNAARDVAGGEANVSLEQIVAWDPAVILVACSAPEDSGVDVILNAAHLKDIRAVRSKKVFNVFYPHCRGRPITRNLMNILLFAKLLHPDRFADLDIEKEGDEIYRAFYGVDGVFSEYAAYLGFFRDYVASQRSN